MDQNEICSDFFRQYLEIKSAATESDPVVDFNWVEHLTGSTDPRIFIYRHPLVGYYREICNEISRFNEYCSDIEHWAKVLDTITDEQAKWSCRYENVDPKAILCLLFPKAIAERFSFATANLSHLANRTRMGGAWVNDLEVDHEINFNECGRVSAAWDNYNKLKLSLEKIDNRENRSRTDDFRNAFAHQFPARIESGYQSIIKFVRNDNPKNLTLTFGEQKPLKLAEIIEISRAQIKLCIRALEAFKALVNEQYSYLLKSITQNPSSG